VIPESIKEIMSTESAHVFRKPEKIHQVVECLETLGVADHDQLKEIFTTYNLNAFISKRLTELMDLCSPTPQIAETTDFGRDIYEVPEEYICLTSGEGEGFFLYSKLDRKVYDVDVSELEALDAGEKEARWETFFDLIEWYVSPEEDDMGESSGSGFL